MNSELIATYLAEKHRFENSDSTSVIILTESNGRQITMKGSLSGDEEFVDGVTYRFLGHETEYTNRHNGRTEKQFAFSSYVTTEPSDRYAYLAYLESSPGITPATANKLWEKFGKSAIDNLIDDPAGCTAVSKFFTLEKAEMARAFLLANRRKEQTIIELTQLFENRKFPKTVIKACIEKWGTAAARKVRRNPYLLIGIKGIGFDRADNMYVSLGLSKSKLRRQSFCLWNSVRMASAASGSTWITLKSAIKSMEDSIGVKSRPWQAIRLAMKLGLVEIEWTDGDGRLSEFGENWWIAVSENARNERKLASHIVDAVTDCHEPFLSPDSLLGLSDHQASEISRLFEDPSCVKLLIGGGGTGKSYTTAQVVAAAVAYFGQDNVAAAAPTGKAAVRMTELLSSIGVEIAATTWHRLLGWNGTRFEYGADHPLPYSVVFGDEESMQDCQMAVAAFNARARGCLYFFIGDPGQLPPVGNGSPLRDMIAAQLPTASLAETRRNSGEIVQECNRIRVGECSICPGETGNLEFIPKSRPQQIIDVISERLMKKKDPVWGCQVITPCNSGPLGRETINPILQNLFNQNKPVRGTIFRVGDKVVCTKNAFFLECDEYGNLMHQQKAYVANGDVGKVLMIDDSSIVIKVFNPERIVRVYRTKSQAEPAARNDRDAVIVEEDSTGSDWELAYAITCHKSQGAEYPYAIVVIDDSGSAKRVCSREWMYTAISRAKKSCCVVGRLDTMQSMVKKTSIQDRKTFLVDRILQSWMQSTEPRLSIGDCEESIVQNATAS